VLSISALAALLAGCTLTPSGTDAERARLEANADRYERPFAERALPELPQDPTWEDLLHRAFLANGELEAAYFEWKAALERVDIASAYPNTNVGLGFEYMFSRERMKTFDRMTFSARFDAMENLALPPKVAQAGKVALDEARVAGERFRTAKFNLQERVLGAWAEYWLLVERGRILDEQVQLLRGVFDTARARVQAGGPQEDLLRAEIEVATAEDALLTTEADIEARRAGLNALLARQPDALLAAPPNLPEPRALTVSDADLILMAAGANPELAALAREVEGRADALELARLQWLPDINPSAAFTGGAAQVIGAMIMLPTTVVEIRGTINEAQAMVRATEASLRQATHDRASEFVAALVSLRDSERRADLFETRVLPVADRASDNVRASYSAGRAGYLDLIEAQRILLDVRLMIAEARAMREQRLAELERLAGVDVESLMSLDTRARGIDGIAAQTEGFNHE